MARASKTPTWLVVGLTVSGLAVVLSALVLLKSPTSSPLNPDRS